MDLRAAWWDFCFAWFRPCPLLSVVMYPFVPKTSHPINPLQPNPTLLARHSIERTPFAYPSVDRLSPWLSIGVAVARRASCRPFTSTDTAETNHFSHQQVIWPNAVSVALSPVSAVAAMRAISTLPGRVQSLNPSTRVLGVVASLGTPGVLGGVVTCCSTVPRQIQMVARFEPCPRHQRHSTAQTLYSPVQIKVQRSKL